MSKNLESVAHTLCSFQLLSWDLLLLSCTLIFLLHFCAFLAKFRDLLSLFFHSPLAIFLFIVAQLHAYVVCIALPAGLAVVPTQGSYFVFVVFCVLFLENKYALAQRG